MPSIGQENLEAVMIDSGPMPQRRRRPRPEVESIIDRAIEKGNELLEGATDVGYEDSYEAWVRWHADTREALNAAFEGDEMEASTTTSPRAVRSTSGPERGQGGMAVILLLVGLGIVAALVLGWAGSATPTTSGGD
jgi:hypothetical protein